MGNFVGIKDHTLLPNFRTFLVSDPVGCSMSVANSETASKQNSDESILGRARDAVATTPERTEASLGLAARAAQSDDPAEYVREHKDEMEQMGARRIGSLAIGIAVVGIVLNKMSNLDVVTNSTGVIDVNTIFQTAGSGLNLLVVGVIIAAAAVLLSLWSGF